MSWAIHDNHIPTKEICSAAFVLKLYNAALGEAMVNFHLPALRFHDLSTREERVKIDRLSMFRELRNQFTENCKTGYCPGDTLILDKHLLAFRWRCSFRIYIAKNLKNMAEDYYDIGY